MAGSSAATQHATPPALEPTSRAVCKRRGAAGSGPVFLKHNIRNAYDELSDLAELYAFTRAPAVCILHDGAVKVLTDAALTLP